MRIPVLAALTVLAGAAPLRACLWDYDTLRDERRGMPGIAEVLAGQWERHTGTTGLSSAGKSVTAAKAAGASSQ